jgi:hypothetical protein
LDDSYYGKAWNFGLYMIIKSGLCLFVSSDIYELTLTLGARELVAQWFRATAAAHDFPRERVTSAVMIRVSTVLDKHSHGSMELISNCISSMGNITMQIYV